MRANASLLPIDFAGTTTRRANLIAETGRDLSGPRARPDDRQPRERTTTRGQTRPMRRVCVSRRGRSCVSALVLGPALRMAFQCLPVRNSIVETGRDLSGPRARPDDRQPRERTTTRDCPVRVQGCRTSPRRGRSCVFSLHIHANKIENHSSFEVFITPPLRISPD